MAPIYSYHVYIATYQPYHHFYRRWIEQDIVLNLFNFTHFKWITLNNTSYYVWKIARIWLKVDNIKQLDRDITTMLTVKTLYNYKLNDRPPPPMTDTE